MMDHHHNSQKDNANDIQVLEVHNQRTSKPKRSKDNLKLAEASHCNTASRNNPDVEIIECSAPSQNHRARKDLEVIQNLLTPQAIRSGNTDIQILRDYPSSSKNGQCIQGRSVTRRPFKVRLNCCFCLYLYSSILS